MGKKNGFGKVVKKEFIPAHEKKTIIPIGAVMIPHTEKVPAKFSLYVEIEDKQARVSVEKDFYKEISEGDSVYLEYNIGRFFKGLNIKNIFRA